MSLRLANNSVISDSDLLVNGLGYVDYKSETFQTGEVIRAGIKNVIAVVHYGIIVVIDGVPYVLHNPIAGPVSKDTIDDFFKTRYSQKHYVKQTNDTSQQLLDKFNALKDKKFNLISFNCEDFINQMIGSNRFYLAKCVFILSVIAAIATYYHF